MPTRSGVGLRKSGSRRWRAHSRLMTRDELKRHEAGAERLTAAFGGGTLDPGPVRLTPAQSSRLRGMLLGLGLRRRDEVKLPAAKTAEVDLQRVAPGRRGRSK